MRRLPSKANGFVTTATLSAPSSLASEATTGAAPLPVPPPRPEVMKIMSEPSSASIIFSVSSRAALRPTSGFAPAPRPLVSFAPSCNFTGACDSFSAFKSVFAVMNSTPSTLARIMRFTALHPPPPTPMTLIFAPSKRSSLNEILIPDSFGVIVLPPYCPPAPPLILRATSLASEHAFQFRHQCSGTLRRHAASMRSVQQQPYNGRVLGLGKLFGHIFKPARRGTAHRQREHALG